LTDEELQGVCKETEALLKQAMDAFALEKLGDDYLAYRKARTAQAKRDFSGAIGACGVIKTKRCSRMVGSG